jgi:hypothetical protein
MDDDKIIITMNDVMQAGHCARGARRWFENHDLDFRSFLKNGIDSELFVEKGDHLAQDVVDKVKARKTDGQEK